MTHTPPESGEARPRPLTADPDPLLATPGTEVVSETGRDRVAAGQPTTPSDIGVPSGAGGPGSGSGDGAADRAAATAGEAAEGAKEVAGKAAQSGAEVAATAKEDAREVVNTAKGEVRSIAEDAASQARNLVGETQSELRQQAETQAGRLADTLGDVSSQLQSLLGSSPAEEGMVADLVRDAADRTGAWADKVRQGGLDGMLDDARRFARQRPGVFLLGALGAGLVVGRIMRNADTQGIVDAAKQAASGEESSQGSSQGSSQEVLGSGSADMTASTGSLPGSVPEIGG